MDRSKAIEIIHYRDGKFIRQAKGSFKDCASGYGAADQKEVKGKLFLSDGKYHFNCSHCNALIRPGTSERICCLCDGELSWKNEIEKGNVILR